MACRAILSNLFEEQWTHNNPQYLSRLSRALFLTTFLEITVWLAPGAGKRRRIGYLKGQNEPISPQGSPLSPTSINFSYGHLINPSFLKLFQLRKQHSPRLFLLKTKTKEFFYCKAHNAWQRAKIQETMREELQYCYSWKRKRDLQSRCWNIYVSIERFQKYRRRKVLEVYFRVMKSLFCSANTTISYIVTHVVVLFGYLYITNS